MRKIEVFEAKQKLSELVERAAAGERIGLTRRGKLAAMLGPATGEHNLRSIFENLEAIRQRTRRVKNISCKASIEEGRS
ncbi:MAG: type II toxin-antitoxin system prevent-host-death family antitoxin [Acidobacteria bacterium]|nr:type II toxin-antitoxin system prevent-host-death family antitoxin [Acidobacteriota bacterium]